ncbi:hypothetical protein [Streptomyces nigrescens]
MATQIAGEERMGLMNGAETLVHPRGLAGRLTRSPAPPARRRRPR